VLTLDVSWFSLLFPLPLPSLSHTYRYVDVATRSEWKAITGGANLPAINELLEPFGCALGNRVYRGQINLRGSDKSWDYASGTSLALWPRGGKILLAKAPFVDSTATVLFDGHEPKADNVRPKNYCFTVSFDRMTEYLSILILYEKINDSSVVLFHYII